MKHLVSPMPWQDLKQFTAARIALGRAGVSLPTEEILQFGLAHAQARDAVHTPLNLNELSFNLVQQKFRTLHVHTQAQNRSTYLKRPDLGRLLADESKKYLLSEKEKAEVCIVLADGLSALAVQSQALPLLLELREQLKINWQTLPIVVATQARVALGDAIGDALSAELVIVLIGERPGLSSPDSLGAYITFSPKIGRTDAERNCVSNIRPKGLDFKQAAYKIKWLSESARQMKLSGVALKDESDLVKIS